MNNDGNRKILKRVLALLLSLSIATGIGLTYSAGDGILRAEPVPADETTSTETGTDETDTDDDKDTKEKTETVEEKTVTAKEAAAEEDKEFPAQKLMARAADGARVTVHAPEGALPAGCTVEIKAASDKDEKAARKAVSKVIGDDMEISDAKAYDITIRDKSKKKVQPETPVKVSLTGTGVGSGEYTELYHMDDGKAGKVADVGGSSASFSVAHFSVFVFAEIDPADEAEEKGVSIRLSEGNVRLERPGCQFTVKATVKGVHGNTPDIEWASADESVATVDQDGTITGVAAGTTTVTASITAGEGDKRKEYSKEVIVEVCDGSATSLVLDEDSIEFDGTGGTFTVKASLTGAEAGAEMPELTWTSSNESVATVENGTITAVGTGEATITACAEHDGMEYTAQVSVMVKSSDASLRIAPDKADLAVGDKTVLSAVMAGFSGDEEVIWTSSDEDVVSVASDGQTAEIKAEGVGRATVTAEVRTGKSTHSALATVCVSDSGKWKSGDDEMTWALSGDGVLTISGKGGVLSKNGRGFVEKRGNDGAYGDTPWQEWRAIVKEAVLEEGITEIGARAFEGCSDLRRITFNNKDDLESIGSRAFYRCTRLADIDVTGCTNLRRISEDAFEGCGFNDPDMSTLTSLEVIGDHAFRNSAGVVTIDLSDNHNLQRIGDEAFCRKDGTSFLTDIDLSGCSGLTHVGIGAFRTSADKPGTLLTADLSGTALTEISDRMFENQSELHSVSIPAGVRSIGLNAFSGCSGLRTITWEPESYDDKLGDIFSAVPEKDRKEMKIIVGADVRKLPADFFAAFDGAEFEFCHSEDGSARQICMDPDGNGFRDYVITADGKIYLRADDSMEDLAEEISKIDAPVWIEYETPADLAYDGENQNIVSFEGQAPGEGRRTEYRTGAKGDWKHTSEGIYALNDGIDALYFGLIDSANSDALNGRAGGEEAEAGGRERIPVTVDTTSLTLKPGEAFVFSNRLSGDVPDGVKVKYALDDAASGRPSGASLTGSKYRAGSSSGVDVVVITLSGDGKDGTPDYEEAVYRIAVRVEGETRLCTISFEDTGDTIIPKIRGAAGTKVTKPTDPEREGYRFDGWTSGGAKLRDFPETLTGDMTLTAKWVKKKDVTVTVRGRSGTYTYDGEEHVVTGYDISVPAGSGYSSSSVSFSGTGQAALTDAGKEKMGLTPEQFRNTDEKYNVKFEVEDGSITVRPADVTVRIKGNTGIAVYDGQEHSVSGYTAEIDGPGYTEEDFELTGSAEAKLTDAGKAEMGLKFENTNDSGNYGKVNFEIQDGYIRIKPRPVVVTADNTGKKFGEDDPELTASEAGLVEGDSISYKLNREKGEKTGEYTITPSGYEKQGNYSIDYVAGKFVISRSAFYVTAVNYSGEYDGEPHAAGAEASVDERTSITYSTDGGRTWTEKAPEITEAGILNFRVRATSPDHQTATSSGTLIVLPKQITVKADDISKTYGNDDPALTASSEGLIEGDDVSYTISREPGEDVREGGYMVMPAGEQDQGNYSVSYEPGNFTIDPLDGVIVSIKGNDVTATYDGKLHSAGGYSFSSSSPLYEADGFEFEGKASASSRDVTDGSVAMGLSADKFANVDPNFTNVKFEVTDGSLTVEPATAVVNITGHAASAEYDGDEHSVSGYDVVSDNPAYTEADIEFSGDAEAVLKDAGTESMGLKADQFSNNNPNFSDVTFNVTDGFQVISRKGELVVTVMGHNGTSAYDGQQHETEGYDVLIPEGSEYSEEDIGFTGKAVAAATDAGTESMGLSADQFTNKNDKFENVTFNVIDGSQRIIPADVTVRISGHSVTAAYDGKDHRASGFEVSDDSGLYTEDDLRFRGGSEAQQKDAGTSVMGLAPEQFSNKNKNFRNVTFEVTDGSVTVTPAEIEITSESAEKEYNGDPLTADGYEITGGAFAAGEGLASVTIEGSRTVTGSSPNVITGYELKEGTDPSNYVISTKTGDLTVTDRIGRFAVTLKANSGSFMYDNTEKSISGFENDEFTFGSNSFKVSGIEAYASAYDAGEYETSLTGTPVVSDSEGNDVTEQFDVSVEPGTLSIGRRTVMLTSESVTAAYTGDALKANDVKESGDGFAEGDGAEYKVSGSRTETGISENSFKYQLSYGTRAENYNIITRPGLITVTSSDAEYEITMKALSGMFMYDRTEHEVSGFESNEFMIDGKKYTVGGLEASAKATHAGTYSVTVSGKPFVTDSEGRDVTDKFSVLAENGTMEITRRNVIMTSASEQKTYDGNDLMGRSVTESGDGFARGDGAEYTVTGRRTAPGVSENTFSYELKRGTSAEDYNISTVDGQLTVLNRPEDSEHEITVRTAGGSFVYDGTEHTAGGIVDAETGEAVASGPVKIKIGDHTYTLSGMTASRTEKNAGTYPVIAYGTPYITDEEGTEVTSQFRISFPAGSLEIQKRNVIFTSGSAVHAYNGKALTSDKVETGGDGFAEGEGAEFTVTGRRAIPGTSANTFSYKFNDGTDPGNYEVSVEEGLLTVTDRKTKYVITLTPYGFSYLYDGDEKSVAGFVSDTVEIDGETYTISGLDARVSGTNAGTYDVEVTGKAVVRDNEGNDVTDQFAVRTEKAVMEIRPRKVTLRSEDISHEFDGKPHSGGELAYGGDGFAGDDGVDVEYAEGRTLIGVSENAFTWKFSEGTDPVNYEVETAFGLISITNSEAKHELSLQANSGEFRYDGEEHRVDGFEKTEFYVEGKKYRVSGLEAGAAGTEAGEYITEVSGIPVVTDEAGNDVTDQFAVSVKSGVLVIVGDDAAAGTLPGEDGTDQGDGTIPYSEAPASEWALINLILAGLAALTGLIKAIVWFSKGKKKKGLQGLLVSEGAGIASLAAFAVTEDVTNVMGMTDKHTPLMAALLIAGLAAALIRRRKKEPEPEELETAEPASDEPGSDEPADEEEAPEETAPEEE